MFFYILLFVWILVVPAIIILSRKNLKSNIILILAQVYNLIIGLTAWVIFSILLIPFNRYMNKKIHINTISYTVLSILMIGLGIMFVVLLSN